MKSAEEIVELWRLRRTACGPSFERMEAVKRLVNGDVVIPLWDLDRHAMSNTANLLSQGLDQMAMRVTSTMPRPFFPPLREGIEKEAKAARYRGFAIDRMWDANGMKRKLRRRARQLLGYGSAPVMLKPDWDLEQPRWYVRDRLDTFPCPRIDPDDLVPDDVIFCYVQPLRWLLANFGSIVLPDGMRNYGLHLGTAGPDAGFRILEYVDGYEIVLVAVGAEHQNNENSAQRLGAPFLELMRLPNRAEVPLVVMPERITIDAVTGQFDGMVGMYYTQARLTALNLLAVEKGIFADTYLVARPNENPEIVQLADGRKGQLGVVTGGQIDQLQLNPGYKTDTALAQLERQQRLEGGIPADFGGESGTNVRTGRRGEAILSAAIDFRVQEAQVLFEQSLLEEDRIAIAIDKAYWRSTTKSFFLPGRTAANMVTYTPGDLWVNDTHYVSYSATGTDINNLVIGLGQRLAVGTMSKESARQADPLIEDPDLEHDRVIAEAIEAATLTGLQQMAASPQSPFGPDDWQFLGQRIEVYGDTLYQAIERTQKRAQERQATEAPPGSPETQPGLSAPGTGQEQPQIQPTVPEERGSVGNLANLLSRLNRPAQLAQTIGTPTR